MNSRLTFGRADAVDTQAMTAADIVVAMPRDPLELVDQMARADHADWVLLRLVLCAAAATLLLALASSLGL